MFTHLGAGTSARNLNVRARPGRSGDSQSEGDRRMATRSPIPLAPGKKSARLKSAMRSGMPQPQLAGLLVLRIDPPKACLTSPKSNFKAWRKKPPQQARSIHPLRGPPVARQNWSLEAAPEIARRARIEITANAFP